MSENKIINILIAKDKMPLAGYSELTGDFVQICENMLSNVKKDSSAAINLGTGFTIFYINENEITFMIMAGSLYPKSTAIGCIESIKKEFQSTYIGRDFDNELEYGLNEDFKEKLKMKYQFFNENTDVSSETVQNLKSEMMRMKDEVLQASGLLNQREEEINNMTEKAESLAMSSNEYKKGATVVKKKEKSKKIYVIIGILLVLLLIIYFLICMACQSFTFKCS